MEPQPNKEEEPTVSFELTVDEFKVLVKNTLLQNVIITKMGEQYKQQVGD